MVMEEEKGDQYMWGLAQHCQGIDNLLEVSGILYNHSKSIPTIAFSPLTA